MKVLVLTSGGDAPGMNMVLACLYKKFGRKMYASRAGFKGLINNDILPLKEFKPHKYMYEAGSVIKCSRCPKFKTREGFAKALENAKRFDCIIILGGNGSYKGACELAENGIKTVFIPSTIDNDVEISDYSQGFNTAVTACVDYINSVMPTMEAFDRCCVFQVMGRYCGEIAKSVNQITKCDYLIQAESDINYNKIAEIVKRQNGRGRASSIIIKENIIKLSTFIKNLAEKCPKIEIKGCIIGYLQRGSKPTNKEIEFAKQFASRAISAVTNNYKCTAIVFKGENFEDIEILPIQENSKKNVLEYITKKIKKTSKK